MWSGDMHGSYPTQWALNPSAYQNLSNDQVDWASLAQQWIKMKETFPAEQVPPAPPPPPIKDDLAEMEGGEAPMDMSKDEAPPPPDGVNWNSWEGWQQWGWNYSGPGPVSSAPVIEPAASTNKVPLSSFNYSQTNNTAASNTFDYNHGSVVSDQFNQQAYWSESVPFIRGNKSSEWRNEKSTTHHKSVKSDEEEDSTAIIDAAKRKQLPAWIREGLEKMEREKQKKIERETMLREREEARKKFEEEQAAHRMNSGLPPKSKFDTDSEESEKEDEEVSMKPRKSRFHDSESPRRLKPLKSTPSPPPRQHRTKEQIMQDVMLQVRSILTEILLSVTNEEMRLVVDETMASYRAKAPALQLRKTPALTSLTGKLGLGIYDSESESSNEESEEETPAVENGIDSDQELRERVIKKKQDFVKIEREIENRIREQEEKERLQITQEEVQEEEDLVQKDLAQVEPNHNTSGNKSEFQEREKPDSNESAKDEHEYQYSEHSHASRKDSSEDSKSSSRESSQNSQDSSSRSRSGSSSDSRYKKSYKSSKRQKEKKSHRKRSRSRDKSNDRKRLRRKHSRERRHDEKRRRDRDRSRSKEKYYREYSSSSSKHRYSPSYYHSPSRHRSSSRHRTPSHYSSRKRRHHSYSSSPENYRGKRSSHRSRN